MHLQSCKNPDRTNSKHNAEISRYKDWKLVATCKVVLHQLQIQATSNTVITMINTRNETGQTRGKILTQSQNMNSNSRTSENGENPVYHKGVLIGYGYNKNKRTDQPLATEPDSAKVTPIGKTSKNFKIQQRDSEITENSSTTTVRTEVSTKDTRESESSNRNIFSDSSISAVPIPVPDHSIGNNSRQDNSKTTKTIKNQPEVSVSVKDSSLVDADNGDKTPLVDKIKGGGKDISNSPGTSLTDTHTEGNCNNGNGKILDISLISNRGEKSPCDRHCNICGEKLVSRAGAHSFIKWKDENRLIRMCLTCNQKIPNGYNSMERDHHKASCFLNSKEDNYHYSVPHPLDEDEVDENKMYRLVACSKCTNSARYGSFQL